MFDDNAITVEDQEFVEFGVRRDTLYNRQRKAHEQMEGDLYESNTCNKS